MGCSPSKTQDVATGNTNAPADNNNDTKPHTDGDTLVEPFTKVKSVESVKQNELLSGDDTTDADERRPRSISIITDDGVGDMEETAESALLDIEKINIIVNKFDVIEDDLINLILSKQISYRQLLRTKYAEKYDEDLIKTIRQATSGEVQYFLVSVLYTIEEFIATLMKTYVEEKSYLKITETLTAWNSTIVTNAKQQYFQMYESPFSEEVNSSISDQVSRSLKDIMIPLSTLNRSENNRELEDKTVIEEAADSLSQGPDEILDLLTRKPYSKATLAAIFKQYKLRYYLDIVDSIDIDFHDQAQAFLSCIVKTAENTTSYFTNKFKTAIDNKDDKQIIDIIIGRHTIDLKMIGEEYKEQYGTSFKEAVLEVCNGKNKKLLKVFFKYQLKL